MEWRHIHASHDVEMEWGAGVRKLSGNLQNIDTVYHNVIAGSEGMRDASQVRGTEVLQVQKTGYFPGIRCKCVGFQILDFHCVLGTVQCIQWFVLV